MPSAAGRGRPPQVGLRRAVSAAYYAVFHALTERLAGASLAHLAPGDLSVLRRQIDHAALDRALRAASGRGAPTLHDPRAKQLGHLARATLARNATVRDLAKRFSTLRKEREAADYDHVKMFNRGEVLELVRSAELALRAVGSLTDEEARTLFALALLVQRPPR